MEAINGYHQMGSLQGCRYPAGKDEPAVRGRRRRQGRGEGYDHRAPGPPPWTSTRPRASSSSRPRSPGSTKRTSRSRSRTTPCRSRANGSSKRRRDEENYHRIERSYGSFYRSFSLPGTVDQEHIEARHEDGVLKIHMPKKPESKPKTVKIVTPRPPKSQEVSRSAKSPLAGLQREALLQARAMVTARTSLAPGLEKGPGALADAWSRSCRRRRRAGGSSPGRGPLSRRDKRPGRSRPVPVPRETSAGGAFRTLTSAPSRTSIPRSSPAPRRRRGTG